MSQSVTNVLAVIAGKLCARAIRAAGAGLGSNVPGRVSRRISSSVLANLAGQARRGIIAVSGTNGKSTTSGFISSILHQSGFKLAHNRQGANLVPGITASLVEAANWNGQLDVDYCLFETDEAALPLVANEITIDTIVVTNLFRDQLDRFGELDTTAALIRKGIAAKHSKSILNADDPNVAQLAPDSPHTFYGIESIVSEVGGINAARTDDVPSPSSVRAAFMPPAAGNVQELAYCSKCGNEFNYELMFYGQLGHYICSNCGHRRPTPEVSASNVLVTPTGSTFTLKFAGTSLDVGIQLPGLFNVYNALAAAALAVSLGLPAGAIENGLRFYTTLFGRSERLHVRGKTVLIQLIKNPAGASQAVKAAVSDPDGRILIAINDNYADGRDVSWLWDAEFEPLFKHGKPIIISGIRAADMAVRVKYCGVPQENIIVIPSLEEAFRTALHETNPNQTLWMLPTYTCLLELQKIAKSMGTSLAGT